MPIAPYRLRFTALQIAFYRVILKQENEQQIDAFLAEHPDAVELPIDAAWGFAGSHGRQIMTGESAMDGFYYARLGKASNNVQAYNAL